MKNGTMIIDKLAIWRDKPVASRQVHMRMIGCCFYMFFFFTFTGAAYGLGHESTLTEPATKEQPVTKSQTKDPDPSLLICMLLAFEIFILVLAFAGITKASIGLCYPAVGAWGQHIFRGTPCYDVEAVIYDSDGVPVYHKTRHRTKRSRMSEFYLNAIFFLAGPCVLCYRRCRCWLPLSKNDNKGSKMQVEARHYMEHSDDGFRLTEAAVTAYVTQIREGLTKCVKRDGQDVHQGGQEVQQDVAQATTPAIVRATSPTGVPAATFSEAPTGKNRPQSRIDVKDHPYVAVNEACRPVITETLTFLRNPQMIKEIPTPEIARPRIPHGILFPIGGRSEGNPTNYIETYDTRADRWIKIEEVDPTGPREGHGIAVVDFDIYIIGGFDRNGAFNSCRCFNAATKKWRNVAPMNARRFDVSVAVMGDLVYAIGGNDGHHNQKTAERYDYKANQWSLIASMNTKRADASAAALNDKIYVTGGFTDFYSSDSVEVYDPKTNQWTFISPMLSPRSGHSCVALHGSLYAAGGFNGDSHMRSGEMYNPETNTWTDILTYTIHYKTSAWLWLMTLSSPLVDSTV